jgi:hypothetical protein
MSPAAPATNWRENVAPDELTRYKDYARILAGLQSAATRKLGRAGRALHRKGHLGAAASFEVFGNLPEPYAAGFFARPGSYRGYVRFSNGGPVQASDCRPDVRGLAVKVLGVSGKKLIPGLEAAPTHDFLAVHTPVTPFRNADEFVKAIYAGRNMALALPHFFAAFGIGRSLTILKKFAAGAGEKIASLGRRRFFSALPVAYGAYAAKYSFTSVGADDAPGGPSGPTSDGHFGSDLADRLARGPLAYDFGVQLFRDEVSTPIEDGSVEWSEAVAPFVTVGRLTIPKQDARSSRGQKLADYVETLSFDPWHALVEHRPLGDIMRARNVAYRVSTQARKAAAEPNGSEGFD